MLLNHIFLRNSNAYNDITGIQHIPCSLLTLQTFHQLHLNSQTFYFCKGSVRIFVNISSIISIPLDFTTVFLGAQVVMIRSTTG